MSVGGRVVVVGSLNVDLVSRVERLPAPGETVSGSDLVRTPGGKGLNQAVAAARAGVPVAMVGRVGDDDHGRMLRALVEAEGIDPAALLDDPAPTGTALITVAADGGNVIVVSAGANAATDAAQVEAFPLDPSDVVVCQAEIPERTVTAALAAARAVGATTVVNQAPFRPLVVEQWPLIDVLVVNETELAGCVALEVPGQVVPADDDPPELARALARSAAAALIGARPGLGAVVVTLGASGAVAVGRDGSEHDSVAPPVEAVDTVGAGDCLTGWLAAGLAEGATLGASLDRAVRAAGVVVQRRGAALAMPTATEVPDVS